MQISIFFRAVVVVALALLAACTTSPLDEPPVEIVPAPQIPETIPDPPTLPIQCYEDRVGNILVEDFVTENFDDLAQFDILVFSLKVLFTDEGAFFVDRLRRANPDVIVIGLMQVLSRHEGWDEPDHRAQYPMSYEFHELWAPHLLYKLNGEPAMMWSMAQMVDPTAGGSEIDRDLLTKHVNIIAKYAQRYPNAIDGIFHDYMSETPWFYPDGTPGGADDVDLDGDGVGSRDDDDDAALWIQWQVELLRDLQNRFGPGCIQLANGALGIRDEAAAGHMAGIIYQHFPRTVWGYTDLEGLEMAIDHAQNRLTPRRGRVWSVLEAETLARPGDVEFRRHTSMLTGLPYIVRSSKYGEYHGREIIDYGIGGPTGPAVRIELPEGGVRWERPFENGVAAIEFDSFGMQTRFVTE